jgi:hypothetical protein
MKYLIILISSFCLFSCSPQKRLERLLKRHPELLIDSVDTVKIPVLKTDSFIIRVDSLIKSDSIVYKDNGIKTVLCYLKDTINNIEYIKVHNTVIDTVIKVVKFPVFKKVENDNNFLYKFIFSIILGLLIVLLIFTPIRK